MPEPGRHSVRACSQCGLALGGDARFCGGCGTATLGERTGRRTPRGGRPSRDVEQQVLRAARELVDAATDTPEPPENLVLRAVKQALSERQLGTPQAIPSGNKLRGIAPPALKRRQRMIRIALLCAMLGIFLVSVPLAASVLSSEQHFFRLSRDNDEQITGERRLELRRLAKKTSVLVASRHHAGSGFIYRRFGDVVVVVTNAHVVTDDEGQLDGTIRVKSPEGSWQPAYPVWLEEDPGRVDIALLAIVDTPHELGQAAVVGRLGREGQYVTCSGFPLGEEFVLSSGYVRSNDRAGEAFKHDCVAERGSSGGPVFDSSGRVVGVTTYLYMPGTENERAVALDLSKYFSRTKVSNATIDAARGWQPVGIWVEKGTRVSLLAEGEWSYAPWRKNAQSRGVHHPDLTRLAVIPELPYASLICKVGDSTPVSVNKRWAGSGSGSTAVSDFAAPTTGELMCRINDSELDDNHGGLTVLALSRN
ncbi:MAG: trypsin-like peptidase domain-containing protein [Polyangiaceae bacterium]